MYRQYKSGKGTPGENSQKESLLNSDEEPSPDPEIQRHVAECWKTILQSCSQSKSDLTEAGKASPFISDHGQWQTVRIFVSSTFNDFFNEREILIKKVFPELREWCRERKLKLVECDLRWGVPKYSTTTQALLTCLEEIDRCYEAKGQPFFLNLLGERYGWIPGKEDVPEEVKEKYGWVDGTSMTFMEILHGALRISNPNAAFLLREPDFISQLPVDYIKAFKGESPLACAHMKALKQYVKKHFPHQVFHYTAEFNGISTATGRELVNLSGFEKFAEQIKEFFKGAIERVYPLKDGDTGLSPEQSETDLQWMFIQDKSETLIGRDKELQLLLGYAKGLSDVKINVTDGKESTIRRAEDWDAQAGDNLLCVVTAQGGWGKTALLAALVKQAKKEGLEVFHHFVGSTATSGYHSSLLQRLLLALATDSSNKDLNDPEADTEAKRKLLRKLLSEWRDTERQMLIVIDGVNELDNSGSMYSLSWLPPSLPLNLQCVISANISHRPTSARLFEHPAYHLSLSALDGSALQQLASCFFEQFGKKLNSSQLKQLMEDTKVDNPLWMILMCEELRIFGDFRMMDGMLKNMPNSMDAFLEQVIQRLLAEDDTGYVKKVLLMTASSSTGLPTDYILQILGDSVNKESCPPLYWAQARRILKPCSRTIRAAGEAVEYFTFVHEAMWKAVKQYMEKNGDRKEWHKHLADFYQYACDSFILRINHLPAQLQQAGLHSRLIDFIRRDSDAARMPAFQRSRLLGEHRCRNPSDCVLPNTKEVMICQHCSLRQGGFNQGVHFPNRDVCYLCSNLTFSQNRIPARICSQHAMRNRHSPNISPCCVCGQPIMLNSISPKSSLGPKAMPLCGQCGFGNYGKMCCFFRD